MNISRLRHHANLLCAISTFLSAGSCLAGRPLSVDDANVNEPGAGHVETWYARQPGAANTWTVAPAYGLAEGIEIGGSLSRDSSNQLNTTAVQAKFRFTESRKSGCNVGGVVGLAHASAGGGNTPYLNGIFTCNLTGGAVHLNLGATHPSGGSTLSSWGLAYEREMDNMTGHVEYFGQQQSKPTFQVGLRNDVTKNVQLDGTVGRSGGESVYSLGLKFMF